MKRKELDPLKMYIRINKNAYIYADKMRDTFKSLTYEFLEVETEHLFNNQYNTVPIKGISELGLRVFDTQVMEVVNDQRKGMGKCKFCGKMLTTGQVCDKYTEEKPFICGNNPPATCSQYGIEWFTPENTYFLKYPKGLHPIKDNDTDTKLSDRVMFGTYGLDMYNSLGYFRLQNARKRWDFKYIDGVFWVGNGIGYTPKTRLDMPEKAWKKFAAYMEHLQQKHQF